MLVAQICDGTYARGDHRCDLHNRFNPDGTLVSFDACGEEHRKICQFKFDKKEILALADKA